MKTKGASKAESNLVIEDFKPYWIRRRSRLDDATKARIPQIYCEKCAAEVEALVTDKDRAFIVIHSTCLGIL